MAATAGPATALPVLVVRGAGVIVRTAARIAGQDWPCVGDNEWRRGAVTVKWVRAPFGREDQGSGFLCTAPGMSAWASSADNAVRKMAIRASAALAAITGTKKTGSKK